MAARARVTAIRNGTSELSLGSRLSARKDFAFGVNKGKSIQVREGTQWNVNGRGDSEGRYYEITGVGKGSYKGSLALRPQQIADCFYGVGYEGVSNITVRDGKAFHDMEAPNVNEGHVKRMHGKKNPGIAISRSEYSRIVDFTDSHDLASGWFNSYKKAQAARAQKIKDENGDYSIIEHSLSNGEKVWGVVPWEAVRALSSRNPYLTNRQIMTIVRKGDLSQLSMSQLQIAALIALAHSPIQKSIQAEMNNRRIAGKNPSAPKDSDSLLWEKNRLALEREKLEKDSGDKNKEAIKWEVGRQKRGKNPPSMHFAYAWDWYNKGYKAGAKNKLDVEEGRMASRKPREPEKKFNALLSRDEDLKWDLKGLAKKEAQDAFVDGYWDGYNGEMQKKRNPESSAASLFEEFHGRPSKQLLEYKFEEHEHLDLTGLGDLVSLIFITLFNKEVTLVAPSPDDSPIEEVIKLCSDEEGKQLFLIGGNQEIPKEALEKMGFKEGKNDFKDHMLLGDLVEVTYQTEKGFDGFQKIQYFHEPGEVTGVVPVLLYDLRSRLLKIAGGQYFVTDRGLEN